MLLRVVPYFDEPVGRVKIQTTIKFSQRYYTTKRLIRDYYPTRQIVTSVRANFAAIYLPEMRDKSMRSETEIFRYLNPILPVRVARKTTL